jgi:hypothetical protein
MFDPVGGLAEKLATNVSRRALLGRLGEGALGLVAVIGGALAFPAQAQARIIPHRLRRRRGASPAQARADKTKTCCKYLYGVMGGRCCATQCVPAGSPCPPPPGKCAGGATVAYSVSVCGDCRC